MSYQSTVSIPASQVAFPAETALDGDFARKNAEKAAFDAATAILRRMSNCCRDDLVQAAKSYFYQSAREQGAAHLFREPYVEAKAERMGKWWFAKHQQRAHAEAEEATRRPYTEEQWERGQLRARWAKAGKILRNTQQAVRYKAQGWKRQQIADELGCSVRSVSTYWKADGATIEQLRANVRQLAAKIRAENEALRASGQALQNGKSSCPVPNPKESDGTKTEHRFATPQHPLPFTTAPDIDEIDRIGALIPDLLRAHYGEVS